MRNKSHVAEWRLAIAPFIVGWVLALAWGMLPLFLNVSSTIGGGILLITVLILGVVFGVLRGRNEWPGGRTLLFTTVLPLSLGVTLGIESLGLIFGPEPSRSASEQVFALASVAMIAATIAGVATLVAAWFVSRWRRSPSS